MGEERGHRDGAERPARENDAALKLGVCVIAPGPEGRYSLAFDEVGEVVVHLSATVAHEIHGLDACVSGLGGRRCEPPELGPFLGRVRAGSGVVAPVGRDDSYAVAGREWEQFFEVRWRPLSVLKYLEKVKSRTLTALPHQSVDEHDGGVVRAALGRARIEDCAECDCGHIRCCSSGNRGTTYYVLETFI